MLVKPGWWWRAVVLDRVRIREGCTDQCCSWSPDTARREDPVLIGLWFLLIQALIFFCIDLSVRLPLKAHVKS